MITNVRVSKSITEALKTGLQRDLCDDHCQVQPCFECRKEELLDWNDPKRCALVLRCK